ncbi:MAG: metal ABC transporter permease, partial [Clostridia bacterium]
MISELSEIFSYPFMVRALVAGVLVSVCASLLGVSLVLKRFSMIGDGLSHIGYGALAIAAALKLATPLYVSIPVVVLAAFLLLRVNANSKIKGDAAIGIVSSASLAAGTIIIALTTNSNADITSYMFGSIYALTWTDVIICSGLSAVAVILFVMFYNKIFAVTFDEAFASSSGVKTEFYNMAIALFTAVAIVIGMNLMGALLVSSLVIFPAVTSMRLCRSFKSVSIVSAILSGTNTALGIIASYEFSTPPGASIVALNTVVLAIFALV